MWAIWLGLLVISRLHKLQNITARILSSCHNRSHELFHIINPVTLSFRIRPALKKAFAGYTKSGGCVRLMTRTSRCENLEGLSHQYSWERTNQSEVKPPYWMRIRVMWLVRALFAYKIPHFVRLWTLVPPGTKAKMNFKSLSEHTSRTRHLSQHVFDVGQQNNDSMPFFF